MMNTILALLKIIVFLIGGAWTFTFVLAQVTCSAIGWMAPRCTDGKGEIWMLPIFTAPIGFPALIASVFVVVMAIRRQRVRR